VTAPLRVPALIVIGGGDVGSLYVRQLLRAVRAGRLATDRVVVVDRDPACLARAQADPLVRFDVADWSEWLDAHLPSAAADDHLVPYHWAPHLLLDWLARATDGRVDRATPWPLRGTPYEGATGAGDRALSYATWICPVTCIEPALCPHTRGPRDWSLAADLQEPAAGETFDGQVVLRCLHLAYGVGSIPVRSILDARDRLLAAAGTYLVSTASHCHGLATPLTVGEARPSSPITPPGRHIRTA
jgi:hypothetical protein